MILPHPGQRPSKQPYHVAIYGAGPAGITLARALSRAGLRTGLFEGGGLDPSPIGPEHPYRGQSLGRLYEVAGTRLRYFGGTSNHWGGWCRPLDPSDFSPRPHIPLSGWPISHEALAPYFSAAMDVCEIPAAGLGLAAFDHDFGYGSFLQRADSALLAKNFLFSPPTRFGVRYRRDIQEAQDIECFLDATLVQLSGADGSVQEALVQSSDGSRRRILANRHVLAMGAIENARILLHSGLANRSGMVGRCFADHLGVTVGTALLPSGNPYFMHDVDHGDHRIKVLPHLSLSSDKQAQMGLGNFGILLGGQDRHPLDSSGQRAKGQLDALEKANNHSFRVLARLESTPNPESRVMLINAADAYGVPRVAVDWRPHPFDFESVKRLCAYLAPMIGKVGGRIKIEYRWTDGEAPAGTYQAHHLGTTKMSRDPTDGVVNANLRCHDVDNLYVAGSSVFPTFGFANPTLTLVALSLRLGEHLRKISGVAHV